MGLVEAKCTNCGAVLSVDQGKDAMICPYCGSAFVVTQAIQNFNNYYTITNNISAENVFIQDLDKQNGFEIVNKVLKKYTGVDEEVVVPDGVVKIDEFGMAHNEYVRTIRLPSSLRYLADWAFCGCENLVSIESTNNLIEIGSHAFQETAIQELDISNAMKVKDGIINKCRKLETVYLCSEAIKSGSLISYSDSRCHALDKIYIDGQMLTPKSEIATLPFFYYTEVVQKEKEQKRERATKEKWINEGRCKYCGGKLKGLFTRKCISCGKEQ